MNAFDILRERGFFYQLTDDDAVRDRLNGEPVTFYIGIDPTADSMHVGHLLPIMAARWLQQCGHRPVILVGGATALVGDPSGRIESRQMLSGDDVNRNVEALAAQLSRFIDFGQAGARLVNNADWLVGLNYIEFLREIGTHFSVNRMLAAESVRARLEHGLSFLEFNYSLLQAYDFYVLCREYDCEFQLGGQDQWGNIVAGIDLTRRKLSRQVYGATFPLLTDDQGQKFGKSLGGAVWLDPARTEPFEYYQFWRNTADAEVGRLLAFFSMLPMDEINRLAAPDQPGINRAKEILACEATALAHGTAVAQEAFHAAVAKFGAADPAGRIETSSTVAVLPAARGSAAPDTSGLPTTTVAAADLEPGMWVVPLLVTVGLAQSNGAARRLIKGGGAYLNDTRITDSDLRLTAADLVDGQALLRSGKKNIRRVVVD
jgi:tyrosyl-tRNA synthetase